MNFMRNSLPCPISGGVLETRYVVILDGDYGMEALQLLEICGLINFVTILFNTNNQNENEMISSHNGFETLVLFRLSLLFVQQKGSSTGLLISLCLSIGHSFLHELPVSVTILFVCSPFFFSFSLPFLCERSKNIKKNSYDSNLDIFDCL